MPGPFPGMDPYLEDAELWRGAHHWFISATAEQLQPRLNARGYYVDVESRVWMEEPERAVYPRRGSAAVRPKNDGQKVRRRAEL